MTPCAYCGRDNDDSTKVCRECGTQLHPFGEVSVGAERSFSPKARIAVKSGLAALLVCTAVFYAASRLFFDMQETENGGPIGKPGIYAVGIMFIPILIPLAIGSAIFTIVIFAKRCPEGWQGLLAAIITLAAMAVLMSSPKLGFLLPASLLGRGTGSSVGWYVGAAIQFGFGCWLLGWFDRFTARHERN